MNTRLVVLGTGTAVGKTWVAASLAQAIPGACLALKPVETGCDTSPPDATTLGAASCHAVPPLYALQAPVTPWLAAERERRPIDLTRIASWVALHEQKHRNTCHVVSCIVETAGGVFSPITETHNNFHLASALDPATWLLVAPNALGVLHHVSATLLALTHLGRPPDLVVLSQPDPPDPSSATNPDLLRRLYPDLPFVSFGHGDHSSAGALCHHLDNRGR
jgi:dethiobiotin synthase